VKFLSFTPFYQLPFRIIEPLDFEIKLQMSRDQTELDIDQTNAIINTVSVKQEEHKWKSR